MEDHELTLLKQHPEWELVLNAYQQLAEEGHRQNPEFDGWIGRIHEVSGVEAADLPGIHGKLIAFGFLKFDLAGRDGGIRYQRIQLAPQDADHPAGPSRSIPKPAGKSRKLKLAEAPASSPN